MSSNIKRNRLKNTSHTMLSFPFFSQIWFLGQVLGERAKRSLDFLAFNDKCDSSGAVNVLRNLNK